MAQLLLRAAAAIPDTRMSVQTWDCRGIEPRWPGLPFSGARNAAGHQ